MRPIQTPKFKWIGGWSVASIAAAARFSLKKNKTRPIETPKFTLIGGWSVALIAAAAWFSLEINETHQLMICSVSSSCSTIFPRNKLNVSNSNSKIQFDWWIISSIHSSCSKILMGRKITHSNSIQTHIQFKNGSGPQIQIRFKRAQAHILYLFQAQVSSQKWLRSTLHPLTASRWIFIK